MAISNQLLEVRLISTQNNVVEVVTAPIYYTSLHTGVVGTPAGPMDALPISLQSSHTALVLEGKVRHVHTRHTRQAQLLSWRLVFNTLTNQVVGAMVG